MGNRPSEMMDREKAYIPELQISFMEHIAMPIYKCVLKMFMSLDAQSVLWCHITNIYIYMDITEIII